MSRHHRRKPKNERDLERRVQTSTTFEVRREHGKDLSVSMANLLFGNIYSCFLELGSNAYDADAVHFEFKCFRSV